MLSLIDYGLLRIPFEFHGHMIACGFGTGKQLTDRGKAFRDQCPIISICYYFLWPNGAVCGFWIPRSDAALVTFLEMILKESFSENVEFVLFIGFEQNKNTNQPRVDHLRSAFDNLAISFELDFKKRGGGELP